VSVLVVVDNPRDWPLDLPGVSVVPARAYLTDPAYGEGRSVKVFNLCRAYRYQSLGYYVSLLAEARGHKPLPRVSTMEDLQSQNLVRLLTEDLDDMVRTALAPIRSETFELSIYFGRNVASRYDALSHQLFSRLQAPLLRAHFERRREQWRLRSVRAIATSDIPPSHHDFVVEAATAYFMGHRRPVHRRPSPRFDLAILHDPDNPEPPSNARAMQQFERAAAEVGLAVETLTRADIGRLPEFDALFIRDTTYANHYTYRFARRAAADGLVVIDDPDSILRCNNKVYLAELLTRHNVPAPRTLMVHHDNVDQIVSGLGLPCVLKQPDSSFSLGVTRVESESELLARVGELLQKSELIVAQEYLPTEFDWRVGILDRRPLFVCKYFMAAGHWQIVKREPGRRGYVEGPVRALAVAEAPEEVVRTALRAANLIGDGLYGVDIKQVGSRCVVIEVNDNPNVDAGNEDGVLKEALYREIMGSFVRRIEARKLGAQR
jgi:glutathione synthase/RimK-type ligase-like ATP-grasp enzyme